VEKKKRDKFYHSFHNALIAEQRAGGDHFANKDRSCIQRIQGGFPDRDTRKERQSPPFCKVESTPDESPVVSETLDGGSGLLVSYRGEGREKGRDLSGAKSNATIIWTLFSYVQGRRSPPRKYIVE